MINGLDDTTANVTAKNIVLEADTVGTDEKALTTNLIVDNNLPSANNALIVKANGNINLHDIGTEGILPITEMSPQMAIFPSVRSSSTAIETIKAENGSSPAGKWRLLHEQLKGWQDGEYLCNW